MMFASHHSGNDGGGPSRLLSSLGRASSECRTPSGLPSRGFFDSGMILSLFRLPEGLSPATLKNRPRPLRPVLPSVVGSAESHRVIEQCLRMIALVIHSEILGRAADDTTSVPCSRESADPAPVTRVGALVDAALTPPGPPSLCARAAAVAPGLRTEAGGADDKGHAAVAVCSRSCISISALRIMRNPCLAQRSRLMTIQSERT